MQHAMLKLAENENNKKPDFSLPLTFLFMENLNKLVRRIYLKFESTKII